MNDTSNDRCENCRHFIFWELNARMFSHSPEGVCTAPRPALGPPPCREVQRKEGADCKVFEEGDKDALRVEIETLTLSGIRKVAARNPQVMEYMAHWEGRAKKAEAERDRLREALKLIACQDEGCGGTVTPVEISRSCLRLARAALQEEQDR